jgi:hypothetical protein
MSKNEVNYLVTIVTNTNELQMNRKERLDDDFLTRLGEENAVTASKLQEEPTRTKTSKQGLVASPKKEALVYGFFRRLPI